MEMAAAGGRATPEHCNATSFNWWFFTEVETGEEAVMVCL
jgi:hypothetical protein